MHRLSFAEQQPTLTADEAYNAMECAAVPLDNSNPDLKTGSPDRILQVWHPYSDLVLQFGTRADVRPCQDDAIGDACTIWRITSVNSVTSVNSGPLGLQRGL